MITIEELTAEVMRAQHDVPLGIIVGKHDCELLKQQTVLTADKTMQPLPSGALAKLCGVLIFEDPGLPPGNYEIISNEGTLRFRLHLIKLGITVTPDGLMKPADWWQRLKQH